MNDNINDNDISLNNMRKLGQLDIDKNSLKKLEDKAKEIISANQKSVDSPSSLSEIQSLDHSLKEFGSTFKSSIEKFLDYQSKKDEEVKGRESISRGYIKRKKFTNYYDRHFTISQVTATDPNDFDSLSYQITNATGQIISGPRCIDGTIRELLGRIPDIIRIINDGSDTLFVITAHEGSTTYSKEEPVYAGQYKDYWYIADLRYRSPTINLPFRVMEYETEPGGGIIGSAFQPIEKAVIHNIALPGIGVNFLATDITPTNSPSAFLISVGISIVGNLSVVYTRVLNAQSLILNPIAGPALVAGGFYLFEITVHSGDSINFTYSTTGGTIQILRVMEVDAGII